MAAWWLLLRGNAPRQPLRAASSLAALATSLVLGAVILDSYNWARFDSPIEFGFRYQIAAVNYNKDYGSIFLPRYIPANLHMYLLNAPRFRAQFPFIQPRRDAALMNATHDNHAPHMYYSEQMVGLLYVAPLAMLSWLPIAALFFRGPWRRAPESIPTDSAEHFLSWMVAGLAAACVLIFALTLLYFYAATRFLMDVFPLLALLTSIGVWQGYKSLRSKAISRTLYSAVTPLLATESIGMAMLLPFAAPIQHFQEDNPALYNGLGNVLNLLVQTLRGWVVR